MCTHLVLWQPPSPSTTTATSFATEVQDAKAATLSSQAQSPLLSLPAELRIMIWRWALPRRTHHVSRQVKVKEFLQVAESWTPGSAAILRLNKQVYHEALTILYGENYFTILIQPRRALLLFEPLDAKKQTGFGLMQSEPAVDAKNHAGLALVKHWQIAIAKGAVRGKGKQALKTTGMKAFMEWLPRRPQAVHLALLRRPQPTSIVRQTLSVLFALLHYLYMSSKFKLEGAGTGFTRDRIEVR